MPSATGGSLYESGEFLSKPGRLFVEGTMAAMFVDGEPATQMDRLDPLRHRQPYQPVVYAMRQQDRTGIFAQNWFEIGRRSSP
jgi:hypothetical protein